MYKCNYISELVGFATGAVAAVAVGSLAGVLLVVKFICVITGWEKRLPRIREPKDVENRLLTAEAQSVASLDMRSHDESEQEERSTDNDKQFITRLGTFILL